jgi:hypothetical protein
MYQLLVIGNWNEWHRETSVRPWGQMWHNTSMLMDFGASKLLLMADIPPRTIAWDRHRGSKEVSLTSLLFLREL